MTCRAIMLQGTGSDVGKSSIVAGLCRLAKHRGISVAPFKPQNMSNNAAACPSGGEIGRAQALQAQAAGLDLHTDFNPVLLKPQSDRTAQVIVHGHPINTFEAADYMNSRDNLMGAVMESFDRLTAKHDLIIVEGAGSPAEINLRARDIANMGFARKAGIPVSLIGDIDKGGVIASLVGTQNVISSADAAMITSFIINKFRGDPALFDDGISAIEKMTGWPCFGVIPWLPTLSRLPAEDAVSLIQPSKTPSDKLRIAAPMLSRMANFDDADPLRLDPNIDFQWVAPGKNIPRNVDVIMLFGTKSTISDMEFVLEQGWDIDILAHARAGGHIFGICGGYQILGQSISDLNGYEGPKKKINGLGLLNIDTHMYNTKTVSPVSAYCASTDIQTSGYRIHAGRSFGADCNRPLLKIDGSNEGATSSNNLTSGCYVHGLFASDEYRQTWIKRWGQPIDNAFNYNQTVEDTLDQLASDLDTVLDVDALFASAKPVGWSPNQQ